MKKLEKYRLLRQAEFMLNVSDKVKKLVSDNTGHISWETFSSMMLNSYEKHLIIPRLSNGAFIRLVEEIVKNSSHKPLEEFELARDYDHALVSELLPILIKRMKELMESTEKDKPSLFPYNSILNTTIEYG